MNRVLCYCLSLAGLLMFGSPYLASEEPEAPFFPLKPGTSWAYEGTAQWSASGERAASKKIRYSMKVSRVVERDNLRAAVVSGYPGDLDWSEGDRTALLSLIVETKDGRYYRIAPEQTDSALKRLADPSDKLDGLLLDDDWFLEKDPAAGKKYCDAESRVRDDGMYCWMVDSVETSEFRGVHGIPQTKLKALNLAFRTNPDDTEIKFVPGIGIMEYAYHHHGTIRETELRLVEFRRSSEP